MKPKNVVFFFCDQWRADALGYAGHPVVKTPNLDKLTGQSINFENAFCASPMCCPARVSLFSSQYPHQHGVWNNNQPIRPGQPLVLETFKEHGYHTGAVGKLHLRPLENARRFDTLKLNDGVGPESAWIKWLDNVAPKLSKRELHAYPKSGQGECVFGTDDDGHQTEGIIFGTSQIPLEYSEPVWVANESMSFLERNRQKPFFLFASFCGPHSPYMVPAPYDKMYNPENIKLPDSFRENLSHKPATHLGRRNPRGMGQVSEEQMRQIIALYYSHISLIDEEIGRILRKLEALALVQETIIIFSSDHGELMGDHGLIYKDLMYDECLAIPLLIYNPELKAGKSDLIMSQVDIMPTILKQLHIPSPVFMSGQDILPLMEDKKSCALSRIYAEISEDNHLLHRIGCRSREWLFSIEVHRDGRPDEGELYELKNDPAQLHNLFNNKTYLETVRQFKEDILRWLLQKM